MALVFDSFVQDAKQKIHPIQIEVEILQGMPDFQVIGLGNKALREAKERSRAALKNLGYKFPNRRKIINLSPAHLPKSGTYMDLPIVLGLLLQSEQEKIQLPLHSIFLGELDLNGNLIESANLLPIIEAAKEKGIKNFYLPKANLKEASLVDNINIYPIGSLKDLIYSLKKNQNPHKFEGTKQEQLPEFSYPSFDDIINQQISKRLLIIALSGYHNLILVGPPGNGKSLLAESSKNLLPSLDLMQFRDLLGQNLISKDQDFPGFSRLNSGVSKTELLGSRNQQNGILDKCKYGVAIVDEFPELKRPVLEAMKESLQATEMSFIATMNPCRCGFYGDPKRACFCTEYDLQQYRAKLSGALLDRFDLHYTVITEPLIHKNTSEKGETIQAFTEISAVRKLQSKRQTINSKLRLKDLLSIEHLSHKAKNLALITEKRFHLPTRRVLKLLQVARTIADLDHSKLIKEVHLAESISYQTKFFTDNL